MNFSDSKAGKQDLRWLINSIVESFSRNSPEFKQLWETYDQRTKSNIVYDIKDSLRYRI